MKNTVMKLVGGLAMAFFIMAGVVPGSTVETRADVTTYPLWFGKHQVTSDNMNNLPTKDGKGTASYDPEKKTLTLNGVQGVDGCYMNSQIYYSGDDDLTIVGADDFSSVISDPDRDYGLNVAYKPGIDPKITLSGKLDFSAKNLPITINTGTLYISGKINSTTNAGNAVHSKNIYIKGGFLNAKVTDLTKASNGIISSGSMIIDNGVVNVSAGGHGLDINDLTLKSGCIYAYSKQYSAVYGDSYSEAGTGTIKINGGTVIAESGGEPAVYADHSLSTEAGTNLVFPLDGFIGGSQVVDKESNPAKKVIIKAPGSHLSEELCTFSVESTGSYFGTTLLWNTLRYCAYPRIYKDGPYGDDDEIMYYDLNKDGANDIKVEKNDDGCEVRALGGKKNTYHTLDPIDGNSICDLEYEAIKENATGEFYYLNTIINLPDKFDCGEYTLDFIKNGGTVIIRGGDLQTFTTTIIAAATAGVIKTEGSYEELKIDLDKDGTDDLLSEYDDVKKETTVTLLPDGSLKEDKVLSFNDSQKEWLVSAGEPFYSKVNFIVTSKYDKGETTVDMSGGSAKVNRAVIQALVALGMNGKIKMFPVTEKMIEFDMDGNGKTDFVLKAESEESFELSVHKDNSIKTDTLEIALDDDEKSDREHEGEDYYSKITFILKKSSSDDPGSGESDPKDDDTKKPGTLSDNTADKIAEETLKKTLSENVISGDVKAAISFNGFARFDGRTHNVVGEGADGKLGKHKESKKKAFDIKVKVIANGEVIDPSKYTIKTKNNKAASVSIDGINYIQTNEKKRPYYTIKFKDKALKPLNKEFKKKKFYFGIIPAELKTENVDYKTKKNKAGKLAIKKISYKPGTSGSLTLKPVKMKFSKKEAKTDYIFTENPDGSLTVIGKNNYFGSIKLW